MDNTDPFDSINSKRKAFKILGNIRVLFHSLSDKWSEKLIHSARKNNLRIVFENKEFYYRDIGDIKSDRFHFRFNKNAFFTMKKVDTIKARENVQTCVKNDFWTERRFKLN